MKTALITALVLMVAFVGGCKLFDGGGAIDVALIVDNVDWGTSYEGHPTGDGLLVGLMTDIPATIAWGDASHTESDGYAEHTYTRAATFEVTAQAENKVGAATVTVINDPPEMGDTLLLVNGLTCGEPISVWLNPHVHGCDRSTGYFLWEGGISDPDSDEMRVNIEVHLLREKLDEGSLAGYQTVREYTVYSLHDRSVISGRWVDVMGFWFAVGWSGSLPPYPFATIPYTALEPRAEPKWLWPCPGCDPDDPIVDPDPDPDPGFELGDCFVAITIRVVDKWGEYEGKRWLYGLNVCDCDTCTNKDQRIKIDPPVLPCGI
jgi:hypothetical protein